MTRPEERAGVCIGLFLIALAALFVVHPLIVHGPSNGHDFDFHLVNWMEAAAQFSHGNLHPHWAFSPAYNAGEPRFVFYPPLSWTLGGLVGLLLSHLPCVSQAAGWTAAPIAFTWIALSLSGFTMFRLARSFAPTNAALLAAMLYLANPYLLFTAFERTAYGELLAAAWMPLLLLAILRSEVRPTQIAIPVALLWLTNAPAAVMGCYTLALLALIRIAAEVAASRMRNALQLALKTAAGAGFGLGLAAFYIVPAAYERRFVQVAMATIAGMRIDNNFLFEHTGTSSDELLHDQVLHTASWVAAILIAATVAALIAAQLRRRPPATPSGLPEPETQAALPLLPLAILAAGIALMLTPLSAPIWSHTPQAAFLQFPWRLLAVLAPVLALVIAAALGSAPKKFNTTCLVGMAAVAVLTLPAYHLFRQTQYEEDMPAAIFADFQAHAGFDPTDEYTPKGANSDLLAQSAPAWWLAQSAGASAPSGSPGPAPLHFAVTAQQAEILILNLRVYPAWRVFVNGMLETGREHRNDGLIALPVPAGQSIIDIRYARTPDQWLGELITVLAALGLLASLALQRRPSRN